MFGAAGHEDFAVAYQVCTRWHAHKMSVQYHDIQISWCCHVHCLNNTLKRHMRKCDHAASQAYGYDTDSPVLW